jgi:hypothetical protein
MEAAYYLENIYDINHLKSELDVIYSKSMDLDSYTKIIHRGDSTFSMVETFDSHIEAVNHLDKMQKWYESNSNAILAQMCINGGELEWEAYPTLHNWIIEKSKELFGRKINRKFTISISKPLLTLYTKNCLLTPHKDGKPDNYETLPNYKAANVLLYLNKDYKKEYGGNFIVEGDEVIPEFANILFLNFSGDSDPEHSVSVITDDINRFALLFNIQYS